MKNERKTFSFSSKLKNRFFTRPKWKSVSAIWTKLPTFFSSWSAKRNRSNRFVWLRIRNRRRFDRIERKLFSFRLKISENFVRWTFDSKTFWRIENSSANRSKFSIRHEISNRSSKSTFFSIKKTKQLRLAGFSFEFSDQSLVRRPSWKRFRWKRQDFQQSDALSTGVEGKLVSFPFNAEKNDEIDAKLHGHTVDLCLFRWSKRKFTGHSSERAQRPFSIVFIVFGRRVFLHHSGHRSRSLSRKRNFFLSKNDKRFSSHIFSAEHFESLEQWNFRVLDLWIHRYQIRQRFEKFTVKRKSEPNIWLFSFLTEVFRSASISIKKNTTDRVFWTSKNRSVQLNFWFRVLIATPLFRHFVFRFDRTKSSIRQWTNFLSVFDPIEQKQKRFLWPKRLFSKEITTNFSSTELLRSAKSNERKIFFFHKEFLFDFPAETSFDRKSRRRSKRIQFLHGFRFSQRNFLRNRIKTDENQRSTPTPNCRRRKFIDFAWNRCFRTEKRSSTRFAQSRRFFRWNFHSFRRSKRKSLVSTEIRSSVAQWIFFGNSNFHRSVYRRNRNSTRIERRNFFLLSIDRTRRRNELSLFSGRNENRKSRNTSDEPNSGCFQLFASNSNRFRRRFLSFSVRRR